MEQGLILYVLAKLVMIQVSYISLINHVNLLGISVQVDKLVKMVNVSVFVIYYAEWVITVKMVVVCLIHLLVHQLAVLISHVSIINVYQIIRYAVLILIVQSRRNVAKEYVLMYVRV